MAYCPKGKSHMLRNHVLLVTIFFTTKLLDDSDWCLHVYALVSATHTYIHNCGHAHTWTHTHKDDYANTSKHTSVQWCRHFMCTLAMTPARVCIYKRDQTDTWVNMQAHACARKRGHVNTCVYIQVQSLPCLCAHIGGITPSCVCRHVRQHVQTFMHIHHCDAPVCVHLTAITLHVHERISTIMPRLVCTHERFHGHMCMCT